MKNKLLAASLLSMLAVPAFADDATIKQTVSVTIEEVALLSVTGTVALTITAPTNPGDGFTATDYDSSTELKISSNIVAGGSNKRKLTASITEDLPENWKLSIDAASAAVGTAATGTDIDLVGTIKSVDILTEIGNENGTGNITYTFGPATSGEMMAYSDANNAAKDIEITYTLSAEGA